MIFVFLIAYYSNISNSCLMVTPPSAGSCPTGNELQCSVPPADPGSSPPLPQAHETGACSSVALHCTRVDVTLPNDTTGPFCCLEVKEFR